MTYKSYLPPLCEQEEYLIGESLLSGSDLTDDGAGGFLDGGDEFEF